MPVIDELTAFTKLIEQAKYNDVVCIEDFFSSYRIRQQQNTQEEISVEVFIERHFPNPETIIGNKIFRVVKRADYINETGQNLDSEDPVDQYIHTLLENNPKHYLFNTLIELRFILNPYTFLQQLHHGIRIETVGKVNHQTAQVNHTYSNAQAYKRKDKISEVTTKALSRAKEKRAQFFYRGHSNVNYDILPSIFRGGLQKHESQMYNQLISTSHQDFLTVHRHIDILRKMQHYGMSTRLLDITSNPLIALYFALSGNEYLDGEFIVFNVQQEKIKTNNSDTVEILSALAAIDVDKKKELYTSVKKYSKLFKTSQKTENNIIADFNQEASVQYLLHEIRATVGDFEAIIDPRHLEQAVFVGTHLDNPRINNQSGSFIITSLFDIEKDSSDTPLNEIKCSIEKYRARQDGNVIRYIIPSVLKTYLLDELANLGISKQYIYPDLQNIAEDIKKQYLN